MDDYWNDKGAILPSYDNEIIRMLNLMEQAEWEQLSPEQKKMNLYLEQKKTLEAFLERGAISKAQFDKSLGDLTVKMGMTGLDE